LGRLLVFGAPLMLVILIGLAVAIADDLLDWRWLNRVDGWLMAWAIQLQEDLAS
jgi:hypothetical protein